MPQGDKLLEFRRGMKRFVLTMFSFYLYCDVFFRFIQISCLAFSEDSNYLVTSSSTETVHVFRLTEPSLNEQQPLEEAAVSFTRVHSVANYSQLSE